MPTKDTIMAAKLIDEISWIAMICELNAMKHGLFLVFRQRGFIRILDFDLTEKLLVYAGSCQSTREEQGDKASLLTFKSKLRKSR